jgi:predicted ATPase
MLVRLSVCDKGASEILISERKGNMQAVENSDRFFVLTGGPGSGKTAIINGLKNSGYSCSAEAGREIIQEQVLIGGHALPWDDRLLFAELMLDWEMRSYRMAKDSAGSFFFDRGVIDVLGYLQLLGQSAPEHMHKAAETFRYHRRVFIAPPWQEIFHQDRERRQDFGEAVRTYEALVETYTKYGYQLIELPRVSIEERVLFVLHHAGIVAQSF